jgi:hypothetical protein
MTFFTFNQIRIILNKYDEKKDLLPYDVIILPA